MIFAVFFEKALRTGIPVVLLARITTLALITVGAWLLALISWQIFLPEKAPLLPPASFSDNTQAILPPFPTALFGTPLSLASDMPDASALPPTTLPLTLTGLVASVQPDRRMAVMLYNNRQASYREGDVLPISGVKVRTIRSDGVILAEPQGMKILHWAYQRKTAPEKGVPQELKKLIKNPLDIADYISVSPVRENGVLRGYRINPGRRPELFKKIGFEAGDLAVSINGVALTDEQAQQFLLNLPQLRALTVSVERGGQLHDIAVSLDEGT